VSTFVKDVVSTPNRPPYLIGKKNCCRGAVKSKNTNQPEDQTECGLRVPLPKHNIASWLHSF